MEVAGGQSLGLVSRALSQSAVVNGTCLAGTAAEAFVPTLEADHAGTFTHRLLEPLVVDVGGGSVRKLGATGGLKGVQVLLGVGIVTTGLAGLGGNQIPW